MLAFSTSVRTGRNVPVAIARASSAAPACEIVKVFAISGRDKTKRECAVSAAARTLGLIPTIAKHEGSKHGGSKARGFEPGVSCIGNACQGRRQRAIGEKAKTRGL